MTRAALEDEAEDDPFAPVDEEDDGDPFATKTGDVEDSDGDMEADDDEEIDSDEALGESDIERFKHMKFRGSKKNQTQNVDSDDEDLSDADKVESDDDLDDQSTQPSDVDTNDESDAEQDETDDESVSSTTSAPSRHPKPARDPDREELKRQAQSASTAGLASALSASANADVKKGQAVKKQRQTFDRLLDARIKLQKGITAMNELSTESITDAETRSAARQAEDAALSLWSTIDSIRCTILSAQDDSKTLKRKRPLNPTPSTPLTNIWNYTTSLDASTTPSIHAILDKWHSKTRPIPNPSALSSSSSTHSPLTQILITYLLTTRPQLLTQSLPSPHKYDDTPFYQSLLRDLISSRSTTSSLNPHPLSDLPPTTKLHTSGSAHKKIDTKASKGRKMRYTVHERLENFVAREDRTTWMEGARGEFFGSLFGGVRALEEDEREEEGDEDEDENEGEGPLRLFRS